MRVLSILLLVGCSSTTNNYYEVPAATGGDASTGGVESVAVPLSTATGGATSAVLTETGGTLSTGGKVATGGKAATGGTPGTGGAAPFGECLCTVSSGPIESYQLGGLYHCNAAGACIACPKDSLNCDWNDANGCERKRDVNSCLSCQAGCQTGEACVPDSSGFYSCERP